MWRGGRRWVKNRALETEQFRRRAMLGFVIVAASLLGLAAWYFRLQVVQHAHYAEQAEANRIKPRPIVPGRGLIYDRKGRILADNIPAFRLDVTPDRAGNLDDMLARISKVIVFTPEDLEAFAEARKSARGHRPITGFPLLPSAQRRPNSLRRLRLRQACR